MLCLEIEVNGKIMAKAGVGEGSVSAFVTYVKIRDEKTTAPAPATESTFLSVAGFLADNTAVHWGDGPNRLVPGDSVTIRVLEGEDPDPHRVTSDQP